MAPRRLIFGCMAATVALFACVSNTATAVMMMPFSLALIMHVIAEARKEGVDKTIEFSPEKFASGLNLMLKIAYAASMSVVPDRAMVVK